MANTNAQAIAFSNTKARPAADVLTAAYLTAKTFATLWDGQGIASIIPNDSTVIQDGSGATGDGRQAVTNGQINVLNSNLRAFIAFMEANTNLILNQTLQVEVNGQSRF